MYIGFGKKPKFAIAASMLMAAMLLGTTAIFSVTTGSVLAYEKNQATSQTSECGNGQMPTNVGCQNIGSSIQGDENAVSITGVQQVAPPTVEPPPPTTATLTVIKIVQCEAGQQCPGLPEPSVFTMVVGQPNHDLISFEGSAEGTTVTLEPGGYETGENLPSIPGLAGPIPIASPGCSGSESGPIQAGEERTCTWTNTYSPLT
jgi:hypothetical protein